MVSITGAVEHGMPVFVAGDRFTIDHARPRRQRGDRRSGKRQAAGRVEAFAGQEPHPARAAVCHNAESIALSREPSPNPLAVP